jgi:hypothetical protein
MKVFHEAQIALLAGLPEEFIAARRFAGGGHSRVARARRSPGFDRKIFARSESYRVVIQRCPEPAASLVVLLKTKSN